MDTSAAQIAGFGAYRRPVPARRLVTEVAGARQIQRGNHILCSQDAYGITWAVRTGYM
jgi:hypothetical protein